VALPVSYRATRHLTYRHRGLTPWFRQSLCSLQRYKGSTARPSDCTQWPPPRLPRLLRPPIDRGRRVSFHPGRLGSLGPYARHSTSLCFLTLVPCQFPNKAGTHTDVLIIEQLFDLATNKSARRFAISSEIAAFQVLVACRPSHLTRRQTFTLDIDPVTFRLVVRTRLQNLALPPFQTKIAFSRDYRQVSVRNTPPSLVRPSPSSCMPPPRHALA